MLNRFNQVQYRGTKKNTNIHFNEANYHKQSFVIIKRGKNG
jgi:hypothetical protein